MLLDNVAKAIFFAGGSEWSISPHHCNEKTRELAESWWKNPPNQDMRDRKELTYIQAEAAKKEVILALSEHFMDLAARHAGTSAESQAIYIANEIEGFL